MGGADRNVRPSCFGQDRWNSQFRLLSTETELEYLTGWFVLGYQVTDTGSVGGGFGVSRADLTLLWLPVCQWAK